MGGGQQEGFEEPIMSKMKVMITFISIDEFWGLAGGLTFLALMQ